MLIAHVMRRTQKGRPGTALRAASRFPESRNTRKLEYRPKAHPIRAGLSMGNAIFR